MDYKDFEEKRNATIQAIEYGYNLVLKRFNLTNKDVQYDPYIIGSLVDRYWKDVERLHIFHNIKNIDCHKIAGYLTYWICKLKPFKVEISSYRKNECCYIINELIALYVGCSRVNSTRKRNGKNSIQLKKEFISPFLYSLTFRPNNADWLSIIYYFIDVSN